MKRLVMFLFLLLLPSLSFVSAAFAIQNYSVDSEYSPLDVITGSVDLLINSENYNEIISVSDGSEMTLGDFVVFSGVAFGCIPSDCEMGYSYSSPAGSSSIPIGPSDEKYLGFVLTGSDISVDAINFTVSSNFGKGSELPLSIEFFEDEQWRFDKFSNEFLNKNWGCFNPSYQVIGPRIGNSFYCETVTIGDTGKLRLGARVGPGSGDLDMTISPVYGGQTWDCKFNPGNGDDSCEVTPDIGEIISEGDYRVCVGADSLTDYNIYQESVGDNCGFPLDAGPGYMVKDYAIFAQGVKYDAAGGVLDLGLGSKHVNSANVFIADRYGGDCSGGCVLPLKISGGASQTFSISGIAVDYTNNYEHYSSNLIYTLQEIPAKLSFSDTLGLDSLGIVVSKAGEYFARLLGEDLFRVDATFFVTPIISSVSPLDPSVGVPVNFSAYIFFEQNISLVYEWDFGDNESAQTSVPYVTHTYANLGNYTLALKVIPGGDLTLSSIASFNIEPISPEDAVIAGLSSKGAAVANIRAKIEGLAAWYENDLLGVLEIVDIENELSRLEGLKGNSSSVATLITIKNDLDALNVPTDVRVVGFESSFLIPDAQGIDIAPVVAISGEEVSGSSKDYANSILAWQEENVVVSLKFDNVFASSSDGEEVGVLSAYNFDITSNGKGSSYFVIGAPKDELHFSKDVGAREAGDFTVVVLDEGDKKIVEFYYAGAGGIDFFVSPKLSSFVIEGNIDSGCNFNEICERDLGETPNSCRSDCQPTRRAAWFFIFGFFIFIFIYTVLQVWYKRHYEAYLFKDRAQMYNLLMYVTNSRARGIKDNRIAAQLRAKGWSSERVNYVIRKSSGKSVGMIEILPIEFISALLRKRRAKKVVRATTSVPRQNNANINKSKVRV